MDNEDEIYDASPSIYFQKVSCIAARHISFRIGDALRYEQIRADFRGLTL